MNDICNEPKKAFAAPHGGGDAISPLAGRKVLLIGIGFYDYEAAIANEFRHLGAEVQVEDERPPALRNKLAPLRRKFLPMSAGEQSRYLGQLLKRTCQGGPFDYILIIKGELLDVAFIAALRAVQPNARIISYQWDSMERYPELVERQALFDRVLTFDHADNARYPDFVLRPTFFRPEIIDATQAAAAVPSVDFCFVGWLHHDRLQQVEILRRQICELGLSSFFYLFTGLRTGLELKMTGRGEGVFWRPLPFSRYAEQIAACRIIIDLPHPQQTGLTMRALEAVGTGKKMVTTSRDVALYDFYSPEQFSIIDAQNPRIDPTFLAAPLPALPPELVDGYSLRSWALDILGITAPRPFLRER